jgi:hypothetical protein
MADDLHEIFPRCAPITRTLGHVTHSKRTLSNSASAFLRVLQSYESL